MKLNPKSQKCTFTWQIMYVNYADFRPRSVVLGILQ